MVSTVVKSAHCMQVCKSLWLLQQSGQLCDVFLVVGDDVIVAHRSVLAASAPFFLQKDADEVAGDQKTAARIAIPDVSAALVKEVVRFAYTGILSLNGNNVDDVQGLCRKWSIDSAVRFCDKFRADLAAADSASGASADVGYKRRKRKRALHAETNRKIRSQLADEKSDSDMDGSEGASGLAVSLQADDDEAKEEPETDRDSDATNDDGPIRRKRARTAVRGRRKGGRGRGRGQQSLRARGRPRKTPSVGRNTETEPGRSVPDDVPSDKHSKDLTEEADGENSSKPPPRQLRKQRKCQEQSLSSSSSSSVVTAVGVTGHGAVSASQAAGVDGACGGGGGGGATRAYTMRKCRRCKQAFDTAEECRVHREQCEGPRQPPPSSESGDHDENSTTDRTGTGTPRGGRSPRYAAKRVYRKCHRCHEVFDTPQELAVHKEACREARISKPYAIRKCRKCKEVFETPDACSAHQLECEAAATKPPPERYKYKCDECNKAFTKKRTLDSHKLNKHWSPDNPGPEYFFCKIEGCKFKTVYPYYMQKHIHWTHTKDKSIMCDICGAMSKNEYYLKAHKRIRHSESVIFDCDLCDMKIRTQQALKMHRIRVHGLERPTKLCSHCSYITFTKSELDRHMFQKHGVPLPSGKTIELIDKDSCFRLTCPFCDYKALTKSVMDEHVMRHTADERRFPCQQCTKRFITEKDLKNHLQVHNPERKRYKCPYCDYSTPYGRYKLKTHVDTMHENKDYKPWVCDKCNYRTNIKGNLTLHLKNTHKLRVESKTRVIHNLQPLSATTARESTAEGGRAGGKGRGRAATGGSSGAGGGGGGAAARAARSQAVQSAERSGQASLTEPQEQMQGQSQGQMQGHDRGQLQGQQQQPQSQQRQQHQVGVCNPALSLIQGQAQGQMQGQMTRQGEEQMAMMISEPQPQAPPQAPPHAPPQAPPGAPPPAQTYTPSAVTLASGILPCSESRSMYSTLVVPSKDSTKLFIPELQPLVVPQPSQPPLPTLGPTSNSSVLVPTSLSSTQLGLSALAGLMPAVSTAQPPSHPGPPSQPSAPQGPAGATVPPPSSTPSTLSTDTVASHQQHHQHHQQHQHHLQQHQQHHQQQQGQHQVDPSVPLGFNLPGDRMMAPQDVSGTQTLYMDSIINSLVARSDHQHM